MITLRGLSDGWNRFFFEPQSPLPIAAYRILLGLVVLANQLLMLPEVHDWFSDRGVLSLETSRKIAGGTGFNLFHLLPSFEAAVWLLFLLSCAAAMTMTLGLFTRASTIVLFLTFVSLNHRNPLILNSGDTFLRIAIFFMMFAPAGAALSLDRRRRLRSGRESGPPRPHAPWAMRLIQLQLCLLYLYAFIWKIKGPAWLSGLAVYYTARLAEFWRFPVPYVFEHLWTIKLWTWGTLVIELALATLVWVKELRYWVLLGGVLLHLGIDYSMNIPLFAFVMISAYVTFVDPEHLERVLERLKRWRGLRKRRDCNLAQSQYASEELRH